MTKDELCACIEAAARRWPFLRQVSTDADVRLAFEDGRELVASLLPDHGLVRLYVDCIPRVDEDRQETELSDEDEYFVTVEDEGEFVELRTDDDGQWSIYCAEDETAFTLLLDLPEAVFGPAQCEEILDRFIAELAFWTQALDRVTRPAPFRGMNSDAASGRIAFI